MQLMSSALTVIESFNTTINVGLLVALVTSTNNPTFIVVLLVALVTSTYGKNQNINAYYPKYVSIKI